MVPIGTDNSPCRPYLHYQGLHSFLSQQALFLLSPMAFRNLPAYYVKLVPEAHRCWEHCTLKDLDCLTHSIERLFFFYFWNECLNMAPSFAKQIEAFIRIIVTCTITLQNVLIYNMPIWSSLVLLM